MQVKDLNQKAQNIAIPQPMINVFAQSIYAQLEDLAMDSSHLLTLFEAEDYTEVKTVLQSSIQKNAAHAQQCRRVRNSRTATQLKHQSPDIIIRAFLF